MNSTRIRFKQEGDLFKTTKNFVINGDLIYAAFRKDDGILLYNTNTDLVITHRMYGGKDIRFLKSKVKDLLKEVGVQFKDEVRVRTPKSV